jgi:hypothetical protein
VQQATCWGHLVQPGACCHEAFGVVDRRSEAPCCALLRYVFQVRFEAGDGYGTDGAASPIPPLLFCTEAGMLGSTAFGQGQAGAGGATTLYRVRIWDEVHLGCQCATVEQVADWQASRGRQRSWASTTL